MTGLALQKNSSGARFECLEGHSKGKSQLIATIYVRSTSLALLVKSSIAFVKIKITTVVNHLSQFSDVMSSSL